MSENMVYSYLFPDGKRYIGMTKDMKARHGSHIGGRSSSPFLQMAFRKYGSNYEIEILKSGLTRDEAVYHEAVLIRDMGACIPNGLNIEQPKIVLPIAERAVTRIEGEYESPDIVRIRERLAAHMNKGNSRLVDIDPYIRLYIAIEHSGGNRKNLFGIIRSLEEITQGEYSINKSTLRRKLIMMRKMGI